MKHHILSLFSILILSACQDSIFNGFDGTEKKKDTADQPAAAAMDSRDLLTSQLTPAQEAQARKTSISKIYASLLEHASDQTVTVDGMRLSGIKTLVVDMKPAFDKLADTYGSLGEMMEDTGADFAAAPTAAEARAAWEETADLVNGNGSWSEVKDVITRGEFDLRIEPSGSYEDMGLRRKFTLAKPEEFTGSTVCGSLKAVGSLKNDLGSMAVCAAAILFAGAKDVAEGAAAATGVGAPAATEFQVATSGVDMKAIACIGGAVAWVTTAVSNAIHEGNCVDAKTGQEVASAHPKCSKDEKWDEELKKCVKVK